MATIDEKLIAKLKKKNISIKFYDDFGHSEPEKATSIIVEVNSPTPEPMMFKLPIKKLVDVKWVMVQIVKKNKKSNASTTLKNMVDDLLEAICERFGIKFIETIYSTRYGFGIKIANNKQHQKVKFELLGILEKYEIEYDVDSSDSHNISQYKLMQSKSNLTKIKMAVQLYQKQKQK